MPSAFVKHLQNQAAAFENVDGVQLMLASFKRTVDFKEALENERNKINADPNLSVTGKAEKVRELVQKHAHEAIRAQLTAKELANAIDSRKSKLKLPSSNETNVAAALLRGQIRDRFAKMGSLAERKVALATETDPVTIEAILEGPASLSGLDNATRDEVRSKAIATHFPDQIARIQRDQEAAQIARFAADDLAETMADAVGIPKNSFGEFLQAAVPDRRHLEADALRTAEPLAT